MYSHIDKAFFVGKNNKDYYKHAGVSDKKLIFAPHAIENSRFAPTEKSIALAKQWREELGIKNDELVWLFAGKFETVKQPQLLIQAFIERKKENEHLILVGNGHLENELKEKALRYLNIHFLPFQNQSKMPLVYLLGDVFLLTSVSETWGLAINEAMAAGKSIIASTKVGCAIDLIQNGKNGFIFQSKNVESLKEAMNNITSQKQAQEMGKVSSQIIQHWSFEKIAQAIENEMSKI